MKQRFTKVLAWLSGVLVIVFCCGATILLATCLWKGLVATVSAIIAQGPAAIISAILATLFSWYCLIPLIIFGIYIAILIFVPSVFFRSSHRF